jgi:hypothetical protein
MDIVEVKDSKEAKEVKKAIDHIENNLSNTESVTLNSLSSTDKSILHSSPKQDTKDLFRCHPVFYTLCNLISAKKPILADSCSSALHFLQKEKIDCPIISAIAIIRAVCTILDSEVDNEIKE